MKAPPKASAYNPAISANISIPENLPIIDTHVQHSAPNPSGLATARKISPAFVAAKTDSCSPLEPQKATSKLPELPPEGRPSPVILE